MIILRKEKEFAKVARIVGQGDGVRGIVRKGKVLFRKGRRFVTTNTPGTVITAVPQVALENPAFVGVYGATLATPLPSFFVATAAQKAAKRSDIYNGVVKGMTDLYAGTPKNIISTFGEGFVKARDMVSKALTPHASLQKRALQNQVRRRGLHKVEQISNKVDASLPKPVRGMTLKRTAAGAIDTVLAMPA